MGIDGEITTNNRFSFLGQPAECPRPVYDQILYETEDYVVTPTLGSILPNWLLIIPKAPVLNFADWLKLRGRSPVQLVRDVLQHFSRDIDEALWFEHGPVQTGTVVGCGVDQAHIHLILDAPFSAADLQKEASVVGGLTWTDLTADTIYPTLHLGKSYYAIGAADQASFVQNVEHLGSQFLRRMIAGLVGEKDAWNYKTHAHLANIQRTVTTFCHNAN